MRSFGEETESLIFISVLHEPHRELNYPFEITFLLDLPGINGLDVECWKYSMTFRWTV